MRAERIVEAFGAESARLPEVAASLDDAAFARPTRCDPWTVAELLSHVVMTMRRLPGMLAAPAPSGAALVSAAGYYRPDQRFSAATNADRIESARRARRPWPARRPGPGTSPTRGSRPGRRCGTRRRDGWCRPATGT